MPSEIHLEPSASVCEPGSGCWCPAKVGVVVQETQRPPVDEKTHSASVRWCWLGQNLTYVN